MPNANNPDARSYKGNDIDPEADGIVKEAEFASNAGTVENQNADDIVGRSQANDLLAGSLPGSPITGTYASDTVYTVPNGEIWAVWAIVHAGEGATLELGGSIACEWNTSYEYVQKPIPFILSGGTAFEFRFGQGMLTGYRVENLVDKSPITYAFLSGEGFTVPAGETYRGWAIASPNEFPDILVDNMKVAEWASTEGQKKNEVMLVLNEGTTYESAYGQSVFTGWKL